MVVVVVAVVVLAAVPETRNNTKRGGGRGVRGKEQVAVVRGGGVSWTATITKTYREKILHPTLFETRQDTTCGGCAKKLFIVLTIYCNFIGVFIVWNVGRFIVHGCWV